MLTSTHPSIHLSSQPFLLLIQDWVKGVNIRNSEAFRLLFQLFWNTKALTSNLKSRSDFISKNCHLIVEEEFRWPQQPPRTVFFRDGSVLERSPRATCQWMRGQTRSSSVMFILEISRKPKHLPGFSVTLKVGLEERVVGSCPMNKSLSVGAPEQSKQ